jgi:hypothetical protein
MLFVHLNSDYNKIQIGEPINHFKSASIRVVVYTIYFLIATQSITETVLQVVFYLLLYWLYFDLCLNLKRGLSPNYVGTKSKMDNVLTFFKIENVIKFKVYIIAIYTFPLPHLFAHSLTIDQYLLKLIQSIL